MFPGSEAFPCVPWRRQRRMAAATAAIRTRQSGSTSLSARGDQHASPHEGATEQLQIASDTMMRKEDCRLRQCAGMSLERTIRSRRCSGLPCRSEEPTAEGSKGEGDRRNQQEQDQAATKTVADRVGGEIVRTALMKVLDEAGVVGTAGIRVGDDPPDDEHGPVRRRVRSRGRLGCPSANRGHDVPRQLPLRPDRRAR